MNFTLLKIFFSAKRKKKIHSETSKVTLASVSDIKKYDDAIMGGSLRVNNHYLQCFTMKLKCSVNLIKRNIKVQKLKIGLMSWRLFQVQVLYFV